MELVAVAPSAMKRGYTEPDIRHAARHPLFTHPPDDEGMVMVVGATAAGQLLEVGVIRAVDGFVAVHAMPARQKFLRAPRTRR